MGRTAFFRVTQAYHRTCANVVLFSLASVRGRGVGLPVAEVDGAAAGPRGRQVAPAQGQDAVDRPVRVGTYEGVYIKFDLNAK
jgi:hypothetical protein